MKILHSFKKIPSAPSVCQRKRNASLFHMNKRGCLIYQFHFIVSHFSLQLHQNGCRFTDKKTVSLSPTAILSVCRIAAVLHILNGFHCSFDRVHIRIHDVRVIT